MVRRSSRERKHAVSIYDEAKEELKRVSPKARKRTKAKDNDSDSDDEEDEKSITSEPPMDAGDNDDDSSSSSDESDSDAAPQPKRHPRKKGSPIKIHVQYKKTKSSKKSPKSPTGAASSSSSPKAPNRSRALDALRRRALDLTGETPENSLTAAILAACSANANKKKKKEFFGDDDDDNDDDNENAQRKKTRTRYPEAFEASQYTPMLEPIVRNLLSVYQKDANKAHVMLLNLIFRSVGGSFEALLDPDTVVLDDMDDNHWDTVVTSIVDDMRITPPDSILFCACPEGALYMNDHSKHSVAQEEYRVIFEHFWYLVGTLVLLNTSSAPTADTAASSFDIERVRDLAARMLELVMVGQPDLRAAASTAAIQLALASCDGTLEFHTRLTVATRQLKSAQAAGTKTKEQAFQQTVNSLERSCDDLDQVITETVVPGAFMRRYRDSNPYVRASSLDALCKLALKRNDLFLEDKYLKYFGWMMSDKEAVVRVAAIKGLLAPFIRTSEQKRASNPRSIHPLQLIRLDQMEKVMEKFRQRIADCVLDVSVEVQEHAIKLLLAMMRNGMMDDVEDTSIWNQINRRALAPDTSPAMRRDTLHFVLEQMEEFDLDGNDSSTLIETQKVNQVDAIGAWIAHILSDGSIPLERIRVHLANYVVQSIRDMPQHAHLMTNWACITRAIQRDTQLKQLDSQDKQRANMAKQRVLLQILVSAASMEIASSHHSKKDEEDEHLAAAVDPDVVMVRDQLQLQAAPTTATVSAGKKKSKSQSSTIVREGLTIALLKALPGLLEAYKADLVVLRSLTTLPQYLVMSVLTIPQRKDDVQSLIKLLAELFLESTDITVLQNTCLALAVLSKGDHSRNREALLKLKKVAVSVRERLLQLFEEEKSSAAAPATSSSPKRRRSPRSPDSPSTQGDEEDQEFDREYSIMLCLQRLRLLAKRCYLGDLLVLNTKRSQDDSLTQEEQDPCVDLFSSVATRAARELRKRENILPEDEEGSIEISPLWEQLPGKIHQVVSRSIVFSLDVILALTAWKVHKAIELEENAKDQDKGDGDDSSQDSNENQPSAEVDGATVAELEFETKSTVRMRDGLVKLLGLCFDQFLDLDVDDDNPFSPQQKNFATLVQLHAGKIAGDLRNLFPREWSESESNWLRTLALEDDGALIGGFVRFFREREDVLIDANKGRIMKENLLLPLGRGLCGNWNEGNRREAGTALAHIAHPSEEASKAVGSLIRVLKKIHPIRLLESHMACLRQCFSDWMDSEPMDPSTERPSEEEMDLFEEQERVYAEMFKALEHKASRLAASLGVGKLSDPKLVPALLGFVTEGARFAFSNDDPGNEEELVLGSRLSFLLVLTKYLSWIKKNKKQNKALRQMIVSMEAKLREHPEFDEVRESDLDALEAFKKALGMVSRKAATKAARAVDEDESEDDLENDKDDDFATPQSHRSSNKRRISQASSVRSILSSNLSPLREEDEMDEEDEEDEDQAKPSPKRKRGDSSLLSHETIKEASDEEDEDQGEVSRARKRGTSSLQTQESIKESSDEESDEESEASPTRKRRKSSPLTQESIKEASDQEGDDHGKSSSQKTKQSQTQETIKGSDEDVSLSSNGSSRTG